MCVDLFSHVARGGYRYFITFTDDFSRKIKFLRSDRGGEYLSDEFDNHLMECGIVSQLTPPYTPQMNGVLERRNRTLLDMVRTMMCHSTLPMSFWGHALETAAHILNRAPTKSVEKAPYELWKGPPWDIYFYNPEENKVFVARNGKFLEEKFLSSGNTRKDVDLQEVQTQDLRISSRVRQEPDRYLGFLVSQDNGDLNEPTSYGEAVSGNESEQWQEAMKGEMQSMYDNQVWELTDLPQHCRAVGRKWVFKKKTDMDGNVQTFKARLVAKGFTQTHGIDYDETFSPVAMLKSIRILMAISAYFNYEIWQMDVKTAFLNGKLTEDVYMEQPEECKELVKQMFPDERPWRSAYILGIKIYRNRSKRLSDLAKITDRMKSVPYASAIGSIMYAMLCTRPDVAYSVSVTSRYQQNPGEPHWVAVKNILKYSDASFQTDRDDFRSQSGYVFTLNGGAISWKSSKQDTIAYSTIEAEYIAASDAAKEAVWLRNFLSDLRVVASISRPIDIFCDNSGAVAQAKEPREHHKSRHVLRKYHLIREIIGRGDLQPHEHTKLEPRSRLCLFLEYGTKHKGYRCWDPISKRLRISHHVTFWEYVLFYAMSHSESNTLSTPLFFTDYSISLDLPSTVPIPTSDSSVPFSPSAPIPAPPVTSSHDPSLTPTSEPSAESADPGSTSLENIRRSDRVRQVPAHLRDYHCYATLLSNYEPTSYKEASASLHWQSSCHCCYKTIAPFQMDVKNAFLNGDLSEEVYMTPPPGVSLPSGHVCRLRKSLYGLKQAPRAWFEKFSTTVLSLGFSTNQYDFGLFTNTTDFGSIMLLLYVDDMIIIGNDSAGIASLKQTLSSAFKMKDLGKLHYFLGLEVLSDTSGTYLCQAKYISDLLSKAGLSDNKVASTPLEHNLHLTLSAGHPFQDPTAIASYTEAEYRSLADTSQELIWLHWLLYDMGAPQESPTSLWCDNNSAIQIAHNDVFHERTKHIKIDCHFIRQHVVRNTIHLHPIFTLDQPADIFTKAHLP
ncbi:hypothetical protein OSB04_012086 [Centaurea solstitialis]|uniref:Integrase catalytic domain-containing protein n=1 Tax=Centaurea solstitialis TaxID=347529 RepID=A0AA38TTU0_9ASTR|nr:hypothetical protein OSB04_012086 [Centaurea solstitialis]